MNSPSWTDNIEFLEPISEGGFVEEIKTAWAKPATAKSNGEIPQVVAQFQASLDEVLERAGDSRATG